MHAFVLCDGQGTDGLLSSLGGGLPALDRDPGRSQPSAEACSAGPDRPALGRAAGRSGGCPAGRAQRAGGVALAATLRRGRRRRAVARPDPETRQGAHAGGDRAAGRGADLQRAARRGDALDRPDDGRGGRAVLADGAADLGPPPAAAAPPAQLQAQR